MAYRRWFGRIVAVLAVVGVVGGAVVALPPDDGPGAHQAPTEDVAAPSDTTGPDASGTDAATSSQAASAEGELTSVDQTQPPDGDTPPPSAPEGHRNGQAAVDHLGDRLAQVAATHGMTEDQLRTTFAHDRSLWLDPSDRLYYVDPASEEPEPEPPAAPQPTAATTSGDENRQRTGEPAVVESVPTAAAAQEPTGAPFPLASTFTLHSEPGSSRVIYLDFDGDSVTNTAWHGYAGIDPAEPLISTPFDLDGSPGTFSAAEQELIQGAWQRVAEDFAAFDVDVTTEYPGEAAIHDSSDGAYGSHVVIAGTNPIAPGCGCGGIAYLSMFNEVGTSHAYLQPAFAFQQGGITTVKEVAEVVSHEVGHNLGLVHDGTTTSGYYYGHGSWAPIMGVGYDRPVVHWSNADYPGAVNLNVAEKQDDYAVMASFGLPTLSDLVGNVRDGSATSLTPGTPFTSVISTPADKDVFSFTAPGGLATVQVENAPASPNLDVQLQIHDSVGNLVHTEDPMVSTVSTDVAAGLDGIAVIANLPAGSYFATVDGVGANPDGNPGTYDGYTDYGSIGDYVVTVGFGICGIDDDLDDDDASTELALFPTEAADGKRCGDDDWIRVPGIAGTTVAATLGVQDDDLTIELIDTDGTTVLDDAVATSTTPGTVSAVLPGDGDHFLRISGALGAESRYSLSTALTACPPDDQYDVTGDDFLSTTVSMPVPGSKQALMCSNDSANGDFTQLPLTVGHRVEITLDHAMGGANDLTLYLYKNSSSLGTSWQTNPDGSQTIGYVPLETGNHQLRIYRFGGTAIPYQVSVVEFAEPAPTLSTLYPASGPVGDPVTLVGTGFAGATSVTFANGGSGAPATFEVLSDDAISTTVPAGAITGPITVTNGAGSAQKTFTVLEGGRITGTLTGPPNTQIYDCITVWDAATENDLSTTYAQLDLDGSVTYQSAFLSPGTYRISAGGCYDTAASFYNGASTWADADDVTIVAGSNTSGIDLVFTSSTGSITGTVTGSGVVADVCVSAISALSGNVVVSAFTDAGGAYEIAGLNPGTYYVGYSCGLGSGDDAYMIEYWTASGQGTLNYAGANYVFVNAGGATVADTALDDAGTISGHLTSSAGGDAGGACVSLSEYTVPGPFYASSTTFSDGAGSFSVPARVEGDWWLTYGYCRPDGWRTLVAANPVVVAAGFVTDASAILDPAPTGAIEGTVTQEGGAPLDSICVSTYHGAEYVSEETTLTGTYGLYELDPDTYTVEATPCGYPEPNLIDAQITVPVGTVVNPTGDVETGQDIEMLVGGAIEGTVTSTEPGAAPVAGVCVSAYDELGTWEFGTTGPDGSYRIEQLGDGSYTVAFSGCDYDGVSWARGELTNVSVTRPQTTGNMDIALDPGASLSGTITESDGTTPIWELCVELHQGLDILPGTYSAADGSYLMEDLAAGTYDLVVGGCGQELYVPQTVTGIAIAAGADQVQDVSVLKAGLITGTVTGAASVTVTAVDATSGDYVNSTSPDLSGAYQLFVPPGDVKVSFYDPSSGTTLWYNGTELADAETIPVAEGATVPGIDALFAPSNNPPDIYWFSPDGFSPVKGNVSLRVSAYDYETSVDRVEFFVDSNLVGTATGEDGEGLWTYSWNSRSFGDGQIHIFEAVAYDTEDLASTPAAIQIQVDPVASAQADFDGDGDTDIAIYRPSSGRWYIQNQPYVAFGINGDIPTHRPVALRM